MNHHGVCAYTAYSSSLYLYLETDPELFNVRDKQGKMFLLHHRTVHPAGVQ